MTAMKELRRAVPPELATWLTPYREDLPRAWRECPSAEWLAHIALRLGVRRAPLVRATMQLVSSAVGIRRPPDLRPNHAIVITGKWLTGNALSYDAWAAGFAAAEAADALPDPIDAAAARAAACLAFACDDDADGAFYAHRAYAAAAGRHAASVLGGEGDAADALRSALPLTHVLQAYAQSTLPSTAQHPRVPAPLERTPGPI